MRFRIAEDILPLLAIISRVAPIATRLRNGSGPGGQGFDRAGRSHPAGWRRPAAATVSDLRNLPPFEQTISAVLISAKEALIGPMQQGLREFDVTEPQWRILRVINDHGSTDTSGIAKACHLHAPSVTRILKELERRKLVERSTDPADRRRTLASLTPEGLRVVEMASQHIAAVMRLCADRFGAQRLDLLASELRALSLAIGGVEPPK